MIARSADDYFEQAEEQQFRRYTNSAAVKYMYHMTVVEAPPGTQDYGKECKACHKVCGEDFATLDHGFCPTCLKQIPRIRKHCANCGKESTRLYLAIDTREYYCSAKSCTLAGQRAWKRRTKGGKQLGA